MKKISKVISFVLVAVMLLGAVPAYAAGSAGGGVAGFTDVRSTNYYADAVEWAKEAGVTNGTSATTFSPNASVTRAQAVTFLWRAAGRPEPSSAVSPFTDVADPGAYYYKPVLWAAEKGITNGVSAVLFDVNGTLRYDHILTFLCRAAGESASGSDWSDAAVKWAKANGLTDGLSFSPKGSCPRADVVYCLWKELADESVGQNTASDKPEQAGGTQTDKTQTDNTQTGGTQTDNMQANASGLTDLEGARAAIINGFLNFENYIDVSAYNIGVSDLEALAAEIVESAEHGSFYYVEKFWANQARGAQTAKSLSMYYDDSKEHIQQVQKQVKAISAGVVTPGMSDYEVAKALHDYLVLHCAYVLGDTSHKAYGALVNGEAVCDGYARAYRALLRYNGVKCIVVSGGNHAWNIVQIDGQWYHVDTTWDDPTPNREGYVRYNYFLKSDAVMSKDHSGWTQSSPPNAVYQWTSEHVCSSTKYDPILPSTDDQKKQEEQQKQQEELDAAVTAKVREVVALCLQAIETSDTDDLVSVRDPQTGDTEGRLVVPYDLGDVAYIYLKEREAEIDAAVRAKYPDCEVTSVGAGSVLIRSQTLLDERARQLQEKQAAQQQEEEEKQREKEQADARVREVEKLLQDAIVNATQKHFQIDAPEGYTSSEISSAVAKMKKADYSFGDYTSSDYSLSYFSNYKMVSINNYKWERDHNAQQE